MNGEKDLNKLLVTLKPQMLEDEFVFCTFKGAKYGDYPELFPIASFCEEEGLTLVLSKERAENAGLHFDEVFKCITISVYSSLIAVGLTAVVSNTLAKIGISANVIAGYYHDHIFVPIERADEALKAIKELKKGGLKEEHRNG